MPNGQTFDADEGPHVLVVDDDDLLLALVQTSLERDGYCVTCVRDGEAALAEIERELPALVVSDVNMPGMDGFDLLKTIRQTDSTRWLPVLLLTTRRETADVVEGLSLGADDYLPKPFSPAELVARVKSKLDRPPVPLEFFPVDRQTGLMSRARFDEEVGRELERAQLSGREGAIGLLGLSEMRGLELRLGRRVAQQTMQRVAHVLGSTLVPLDRPGRLDDETIGVLMPETSPDQAKSRLSRALSVIAAETIQIGEERIRITPSAAFVPFAAADGADQLYERARVALSVAVSELDMQPRQWDPRMDPASVKRRSTAPTGPRRRRSVRRLITFTEFLATVVLALVLPFTAYALLWRAGYDPTRVIYVIVVVALVLTAALIWLEGLLALRREDPPRPPGNQYPPATAIIAAFLPNEAATIIETVEAFLRLDYPAPLQVILAYNTPHPMPVEAALHGIAERHERLIVHRVDGSSSKAQNVNAGLSLATGAFVGVFDADHQPEPDAFRRAWGWLSSGYDVVQGHCLVRNGPVGFIARMVAVEFEAIYAVAHPGRARMHNFGIFGGSNGYWRTDLLHEIRMRGTMLTEDIDSSLRVLEAGGRVRVDPGLVSRELGTTTLRQVWNQRLRWSQGWFQVSRRHLLAGLRSKRLTIRQKLGLIHLLGWREVYPWLSVQVIPIVAFWIYRGDALDWVVPILILSAAFTFSVGPAQTYMAHRLGDPEITRHKSWFIGYLFFASLFYSEYKNAIARVAQLKELVGDRDWRVTPRSPSDAPSVSVAASGGGSAAGGR